MDNLTDLELEKWFNIEVDHYWSSKTTKKIRVSGVPYEVDEDDIKLW